MLRAIYCACVLSVCFNVMASAQSRQPHAVRKAGNLTRLRKSVPHLLWQTKLTGRATVRLAGVGAGKIAVLAEPRPRVENGVYIPHSIQLSAFDMKSGKVAWRKEILGGDITTVADHSRLYMRVQLPQVSYDPFDFHANEIYYQIVTFRWSDGRMAWHIPCGNANNLLVWNGHVFFEVRVNNAFESRYVLYACDAETGKEKWYVERNNIRGLFAARGALYAYDESRDPEGEYLHAIDPATGKNTQRLLLYPLFRPTTHLNALAWLPKEQILVGAIEQNSTPGINAYQIRALDEAGKPAWDCQDAGRFQLVSHVLICQHYAQPVEYPRGIVAINPANGHELWRRTDLTNSTGNMDINLGEWHGHAVVLQENQLCGLNPRMGKTDWVLDVLPSKAAPNIQQVSIVGDVIIVAVRGTKNRPAQVCAYSLRSR